MQANWTMFRAVYRRNDTDPAAGGGRPRRSKVGVVLGAGAARGWAHIGAMQELDALGLRPDVVVGSSIGSLVGGCYAAGRLEMLEAFARSLTRRSIARGRTSMTPRKSYAVRGRLSAASAIGKLS